MSQYHCPNCGEEIGFGESICPNCKSDVTGVWEQISNSKPSGPKVVPGMGGINTPENPPFPAPSNPNVSSPFPSSTGSSTPSPFPPMKSTPFPPASPFPSTQPSSSPFPPAGTPSFPPNNDSKPFPPMEKPQPSPGTFNPYLDIPRIGAKITIPQTESHFRVGREEIQGNATVALPDLNAYKNISRKRENSEHFMIHNTEGKYFIEDIHSTNGTYLGPMKLGPGIAPQLLKNGDKIIVPIEEFGKMVQLEIFFRTK